MRTVLGWAVVSFAVVLVVLLSVAIGIYGWTTLQTMQTQIADARAQLAPEQIQAEALEPKDRLTLNKDLLQVEASARTSAVQLFGTVIQAVGGLALAAGLVFTWRNLRVAQSGQITDRFNKAIEHLGSSNDSHPNIEIRIGGIYALERIGRDSSEDYWPVVEVLTAYLRHNCGWNETEDSGVEAVEDDETSVENSASDQQLRSVRPDIRAVHYVLGRRPGSYKRGEPDRLGLFGVDLQLADFRGADLRGANLAGSCLDRAHLENANLREAFLRDTLLRGAHLEKADLREARIDGASLDSAHMRGADLSTVRGLHKSQLWDEKGQPLASWDQTTRFPPGFP
jgi:hypothetical protein